MLLGGKDGCALVVRLWKHIRDILRVWRVAVVRPTDCLLASLNQLVCASSEQPQLQPLHPLMPPFT